MSRPRLLACMPADINEIITREKITDLPLWDGPYEGYQKIRCENPPCGRDMWIGPRQQALDEIAKLNNQEMFKVCLVCAGRIAEEDDMDVHHLGGK